MQLDNNRYKKNKLHSTRQRCKNSIDQEIVKEDNILSLIQTNTRTPQVSSKIQSESKSMAVELLQWKIKIIKRRSIR